MWCLGHIIIKLLIKWKWALEQLVIETFLHWCMFSMFIWFKLLSVCQWWHTSHGDIYILVLVWIWCRHVSSNQVHSQCHNIILLHVWFRLWILHQAAALVLTFSFMIINLLQTVNIIFIYEVSFETSSVAFYSTVSG